MATTFDSLPFGISDAASGYVPLPAREALVQVDKIPYGDTSVVQYGGLGPLTYAVRIRILPAALATWRARLGQVKTLIVDDVNYGTMRMTKFNNIAKTVRPSPALQYIFADVEWVGTA